MTLFRPALLVAALACALAQLAAAADPKPVATVDKVELEAAAIPKTTPMADILAASPQSHWSSPIS